MRSVSLNFRQAAFARDSGVFPICLMTIEHASLATPIRISTDNTVRLIEEATRIVYGTTSNGEDYYFFPCSIVLPSAGPEGPGAQRLEFENVNRDYVSIIRSLTGRPTMSTQIVMSNALDTVEAQWPDFVLGKVTYDANKVSGLLQIDYLINEPFPGTSYTPGRAPGLF